MIVYFTQVMHSYASAMAIFAIFNISYALTKIPSGLASDKIGRKPVLILSNILMTLAFVFLAFSGQFEIDWLPWVFAVLWGIGEAFSAGTIEAMMFETVQSLGKAHKFNILYSKSMFYDQLGCAFGAFCAMTITYFFPLQFVAWFSVLPPFMQLVVSCFFVEPDIKKKRIVLSKRDIIKALQQFIKNKTLAFYTLADIYFSTLGDISHRFESAYFKTFTSDWVISFARVLKHIFGMIGFAFVPYLKMFSKNQIYFGSIFCNVWVRIIALLANNIFTPFIHMIINFFYATGSTAKTDILQQEFLPEYRATAQSIIQFIKGVYMAAVMYLLGIVADIYGIYTAMAILIVLRVIGLYGAYNLQHYYQK